MSNRLWFLNKIAMKSEYRSGLIAAIMNGNIHPVEVIHETECSVFKDRYLTVKDSAKYIGISCKTLRKYLATNYSKDGNTRFFRDVVRISASNGGMPNALIHWVDVACFKCAYDFVIGNRGKATKGAFEKMYRIFEKDTVYPIQTEFIEYALSHK